MLANTAFTTLASLLALVAAAPVAEPQITSGPRPRDLAKRATACTFTAASAASASQRSCATIVLNNIAVPAGQTLDLSNVKDNTHIIFSGTTTFGYKEWEGPLIRIGGNAITVSGASGHLINGDGSRWWDGKGSNGGKTKPKFFKAGSLTSSSITGLNIKNTPVQGFSVSGCTDLVIDSVKIDNLDGDKNEQGHNTDAFDVGTSTGVTISNAIVYNQDDCLAINSGSDITFTGGLCSGGHGLSIGSVGGRDNNDVSGITISNSKIVNSQNGIRIKTVYGATGSVKNVKYKDITLSGITKYGVVIEQDYENGSPTGTPTAGVPITDLTLSGITGTVASSATDVYVLCAKGACSGWTWDNVKVTGGKASSKCQNVPSGASC